MKVDQLEKVALKKSGVETLVWLPRRPDFCFQVLEKGQRLAESEIQVQAQVQQHRGEGRHRIQRSVHLGDVRPLRLPEPGAMSGL